MDRFTGHRRTIALIVAIVAITIGLVFLLAACRPSSSPRPQRQVVVVQQTVIRTVPATSPSLRRSASPAPSPATSSRYSMTKPGTGRR